MLYLRAVFPDWQQLRRRAVAALRRAAGDRWYRLGAAVVVTCMHLLIVAHAGKTRLGLPFDNAPGQPPVYTNPSALDTIGFPRQPVHWSRLLVSRWDAQHYIGTAVRGLSACPKDASAPDIDYLECGLGWLPAYGEVGGVVSRVTHLAPDVSLVLLSIVALLLINMFWTSPFVVDKLGLTEGWCALLAFNMFPSAFHLVAPYTEGWSIALGLYGLVAISKDRWALGGALVGAATALKIAAASWSFGIGAAALLAAYRRRKAGTERWWRPLVAIPLAGWGQLVEMAVLHFAVGDAMAFWRARHAFGDPHDWSRLVNPEYMVKSFGAQHMDGVMLFGVIAILALTARHILKKFPPEEAVYLGIASFVTIVFVIVAPLIYWGINRYLLLCPLAFLGMGHMSRRHTAVFVLWLVLCALFYWHVELCSFLSQGNPRVCPCLGHMEYMFPFQS